MARCSDGVSAVIYETYKELSESLDTAVKEFARETTPSQKKMDETSGIAILSFWLQLDDWIEEQNAKKLRPKEQNYWHPKANSLSRYRSSRQIYNSP